MESTTDQCQTPSLAGFKGRKPSSFRLRSSSLNTLRLRRIFDLFDKNNDGMITTDELSQALQRLSYDADMDELATVVNSHIRPGNIGLEFEDFVSLHSSLNDTFVGLEGDEEEEEDLEEGESQEDVDLKEAFKVFDENGDGYISANELQTVLVKLGFAEGSEIDHCRKMILSVDRNHDGRVEFCEFKEMMRKTVLVHSS
ncbi:calcium-binding protein CML42-like [Impatiens glandulifera]|uniref:calcium-binding protein CML42-like n=1 Tax=Impatiens glandulifera TaxID=253017 RepID=UPI001FB12118|nr:calcium-binding protein CML42-like [Impatiens glandulifera]